MVSLFPIIFHPYIVSKFFYLVFPVKIFSLFLSPDLSFCISDSQFLESKLELGVAKLCHRVEVIRLLEIGKNLRIVAGKFT